MSVVISTDNTLAEPLLLHQQPPSRSCEDGANRLGPPPLASSAASDGNSVGDSSVISSSSSDSFRNINIFGRHVNHNVFWCLLLDSLYGVSDSLWEGSAMIAYMNQIAGGKKRLVGIVEAVHSLAELVSALPIAWLADTYGRSKIIAVGGVVVFVAVISHGWLTWWVGTDLGALEEKEQTAFIYLSIVFALWGVTSGMIDGPIEALFADSTPSGSRDSYYNILEVAYSLASTIGPLIAIALFVVYGDEWDMVVLQRIVYLGLALEFFNAFLFFCFGDNKALDEDDLSSSGSYSDSSSSGSSNNSSSSEEESIVRQTSAVEDGDLSWQESDDLDETTGLIGDLEGGPSACEKGADICLAPTDQDVTDESSSDTESAVSEEQSFPWNTNWLLPWVQFLGDFIYCMGSGLSGPFYPLFFMESLRMTPIQVNVLYVAEPLLSAVGSTVVTTCCTGSGKLTKVKWILMCHGAGILLSAVMVTVYKSTTLSTGSMSVVVSLSLLSGVAFRAPAALEEGLLMDLVPRNQRARWSALESVSKVGWAGTAAVGGFIADKYGYICLFWATIVLQCLGLAVSSLLIPLLKRMQRM